MITNPVNLNKITSAYSNSVTNPAAEQAANTLPEELKNAEATTALTDSLELGKSDAEDFGTYKIDRQKLNAIKLDFKKNTESFKEMIRGLIEKQGKNYEEVLSAIRNGESPVIEIDAETRAKAEEAISDDGYWGVNKTSERILDFAKTISGGDTSKIGLLKDAFKEAFESAKEAFGGKLPDISQKTYDQVMKGFDEWENPSAIEESE